MAREETAGDDRRGDDDGWHDAEEARRRGDALVKRMLGMPPKPQQEVKLGKPRRGRATACSASEKATVNVAMESPPKSP